MSSQAEVFAAVQAIEEGRWDALLHRLHGAVHMRQQTSEYRNSLVAGEPEPTVDLATRMGHPGGHYG